MQWIYPIHCCWYLRNSFHQEIPSLLLPNFVIIHLIYGIQSPSHSLADASSKSSSWFKRITLMFQRLQYYPYGITFRRFLHRQSCHPTREISRRSPAGARTKRSILGLNHRTEQSVLQNRSWQLGTTDQFLSLNCFDASGGTCTFASACLSCIFQRGCCRPHSWILLGCGWSSSSLAWEFWFSLSSYSSKSRGMRLSLWWRR